MERRQPSVAAEILAGPKAFKLPLVDVECLLRPAEEQERRGRADHRRNSHNAAVEIAGAALCCPPGHVPGPAPACRL